jgi:hypothetical protein
MRRPHVAIRVQPALKERRDVVDMEVLRVDVIAADPADTIVALKDHQRRDMLYELIAPATATGQFAQALLLAHMVTIRFSPRARIRRQRIAITYRLPRSSLRTTHLEILGIGGTPPSVTNRSLVLITSAPVVPDDEPVRLSSDAANTKLAPLDERRELSAAAFAEVIGQHAGSVPCLADRPCDYR